MQMEKNEQVLDQFDKLEKSLNARNPTSLSSGIKEKK